MNDNLHQLMARRAFLKKGACASLGMAGLASQLFTMRTVQAALLDAPTNDYRAAVCIFLFGGNDTGNMLVPWDNGPENFAHYRAARGQLALTEAQAAPHVVAPANTSGRRFAFHPAMADVAQLFNQFAVSVVANVGTLVEPVTRETYINRSAIRPAQLFSHNTQQEQWQVSTADAVERIGWGGRVADSLRACGINDNSPVSMNISLAGANFFLAGRRVTPYVASASGAPAIETNFNQADDKAITAAAYADLLAVQASEPFAAKNILRKAYTDIAYTAVSGAEVVSSALAAPSAISTPVPDNGLCAQLLTVARLIEQAQTVLNQTRQIFFVAIGGFDNHSGLIGSDATDGAHAARLAELNSGLRFFWEALGDINMRNNVTTFTASDFGRTYVSNGDGSDHGWGGEHLVMGGTQVRGKRLFGRYPAIVPGGPDDATSNGRFIPTTSVDSYSFEIARWLGVPLSEAATVFPNLTRFLDPHNPSTHLGVLV